MLIAVIPVDTLEHAEVLMRSVQHQVDAYELRLDYAQMLDFPGIDTLCKSVELPMIFTLRPLSQGGLYAHSEAQRMDDLMRLCALAPAFMDVEHDVPQHVLEWIKTHYPAIQLIRSYHDHASTPLDLMACVEAMQSPYCDHYKLVTYAQSTVDALRVLRGLMQWSTRYSITAFCMGESGECTRILGPVVGNLMTYACVDVAHATAAGQLTVHDLLNLYRIRALDRTTRVYALLGDPVSHSLGHVVHNEAFSQLDAAAVYVRLRVLAAELSDVLALCRDLPFAGLSITMPLKESIVPLLDTVDAAAQAVGAVNTVLKHGREWVGSNTDGEGALEGLDSRVRITRHTVVIVGAGGAARAIAYHALQRQAHVIVLNRTLARARLWAEPMGCVCYALEALPEFTQYPPVAILINTLPDAAYVDTPWLGYLHAQPALFNGWIMDCIYQPLHTQFIQQSRRLADNRVIYGHVMFVNQALKQIQCWLMPTSQQLLLLEAWMIEAIERSV